MYAVVTFGDADRDEGFGSVAASKILIICHDGDNIWYVNQLTGGLTQS